MGGPFRPAREVPDLETVQGVECDALLNAYVYFTFRLTHDPLPPESERPVFALALSLVSAKMNERRCPAVWGP